MRVLAFDLGGTRLKAGLVDASSGRVVTATEQPSPGGREALDDLVAVGHGLLGEARAAGVGLAVPGLVEDGTIVALPGKLAGIVGVDLRGGLQGAFGVAPVIVNDAIAYGVGEAVGGAGAGYDRVVVVTLGTGVGVAVLERGRPVTSGALGGGILGGQIPISAHRGGPRDTNDQMGTIEALCRAQRLADLAGKDDVPAVYAAHAAGDERAIGAVATYRTDLARALVALAHAHAPSRIVVGGGPITGTDPVLPGIQDLVRERLFAGYTVEIRPAELGDAAALVGLAHLCAEASA